MRVDRQTEKQTYTHCRLIATLRHQTASQYLQFTLLPMRLCRSRSHQHDSVCVVVGRSTVGQYDNAHVVRCLSNAVRAGTVSGDLPSATGVGDRRAAVRRRPDFEATRGRQRRRGAKSVSHREHAEHAQRDRRVAARAGRRSAVGSGRCAGQVLRRRRLAKTGSNQVLSSEERRGGGGDDQGRRRRRRRSRNAADYFR